MTPDYDLLRCYAETNSEEAFAELVRRHLDLVYSAALRQVNGDAHLAQDVTQTVFSDLARKAESLSRRPAESLGPSSAFYVIAQKWMSNDQAILDVYFEGKGATRRFALRKIADEWKVYGIYLAGGTEDEWLAAPRLWP